MNLPAKDDIDKIDKSRFVFCTFTAPPAYNLGDTTIVYISLRKTWEEKGCLDDWYNDEDGEILCSMCYKLNLSELLESTYECAETPKEIRALIEAETDFSYDEAFETWLRNFGSLF